MNIRLHTADDVTVNRLADQMLQHFGLVNLPCPKVTWARDLKELCMYRPVGAGFARRADSSDRIAEIRLNVEKLSGFGVKAVILALAHGIVHHLRETVAGTWTGEGKWRHYHDARFIAIADELGLKCTPVDSEGVETGSAGGQFTADHVEPGSKLAAFIAKAEMDPANQLVLRAQSYPEAEKKAAKAREKKVTYTCPACAAEVKGKEGLSLMCGCSGVGVTMRGPEVPQIEEEHSELALLMAM